MKSDPNQNTALPVLPQVAIKTPCPKVWENMDGDAAKRYCGHCEKHVHNFSELDSETVNQLLNSGQSICARVQRNCDGSIITKDCSTAKNRSEVTRRGWFQRLAAVAASVTTILIFGGCEKSSPCVTGEAVPVPPATPFALTGEVHNMEELGDVMVVEEDEPKALVGKIVIPQQLAPQNPPNN